MGKIDNKKGMEMHSKIMKYISDNYPNCKHLSFKEQDKILHKTYKALGYDELLKTKDDE